MTLPTTPPNSRPEVEGCSPSLVRLQARRLWCSPSAAFVCRPGGCGAPHRLHSSAGSAVLSLRAYASFLARAASRTGSAPPCTLERTRLARRRGPSQSVLAPGCAHLIANKELITLRAAAGPSLGVRRGRVSSFILCKRAETSEHERAYASQIGWSVSEQYGVWYPQAR